jgi:tetratricopeptide (TPR) repeat protein
VLLDRRRVKFWQKWVFGIMALLMAGFLVMIPISKASGCGGTSTSAATTALQKDITRLTTAVQQQPTNVQDWSDLGDAYVSSVAASSSQNSSLTAAQRAQLAKATVAYHTGAALLAKQKGAAAKAQRASLLTNLAAVYDQLGQYQQETTVYGELTGMQPKNATYFFDMGNAAYKAGDTTNALLAFQRFVALAPNDPSTPQVKAFMKQIAPTPTPTPTSTKGTGQ